MCIAAASVTGGVNRGIVSFKSTSFYEPLVVQEERRKGEEGKKKQKERTKGERERKKSGKPFTRRGRASSSVSTVVFILEYFVRLRKCNYGLPAGID